MSIWRTSRFGTPQLHVNFPSATGNASSAANDATLKPATANDLCSPAADVSPDVGSAGGSVPLKQGLRQQDSITEELVAVELIEHE